MAHVSSPEARPAALPARVLQRTRIFLDAIKFEHTVFALPFAYIGVVLADRSPSATDVALVTVAMAGARTVAMGANRIIDRRQDAANPRTAGRPLPTGRMSVREMTLFTVVAAAVFLAAAAMLNTLALALALPTLFVLITYPYAKRFTWLCHWYLGFADGIAPAGGWIAITGSLDLTPVLLLLAVTVWVAGFDLIYACQDVEFDRKHRLYSIAANFSITASLRLSSAMHVLMVAFLAAAGVVEGLSVLYWIGLAITSGLLIYEHSLVKPNDLSRLDQAFFNMNGYIAVTVFAFTLGGLYVL